MSTRTEYPIGYTSNTFYVLAFLPAVVAVGLVYAGTQLEPAWLYFAVAPIPAALAVLFVLLARATNHMSIAVGREHLTIRAGLRPRVIPTSALKLEGARSVDLTATPELEPIRRTNGTDIPGLKQGWFQLRNGEKALLILTDAKNSVYIPTSEGYSLLLSPPDAPAFLDAVKTSGRIPANAS